MKHFVIRFLIFVFLIPIVYLIIYKCSDFVLNDKNTKNSLFIWGDSQTYQGLNLEIIQDKTKMKINSAASHGAGVYDFLVFTQKVPKATTVLISISEPTLLRGKNRDRNISTLSYYALKTLYNNRFSKSEIIEVIKKNKKVKSIFSTSSILYKYSAKVVINDTDVKGMVSVYKNAPEYLFDKSNIIKIGLNILKQKECKIYFVKFPYYSKLDSIRQNSIIKDTLSNIYSDFYKIINVNTIDTIYLNQDKQVMYDYTHLNIYGANQVSEFIGEKIKNNSSTDTAYLFSLKK